MTNRQTGQYEMLVQVRGFGNTHKDRFPKGDEGDKAFAVITAALADIDAFTKDKLRAKRVSNPSKRAAKRLLSTRIGTIARSARVMAKVDPAADERFPLPTRRGDIAVLQVGRLFLEEAAPVKESFIRCGLPPTFLEELQQAVTTFEQAISGRSASRTGGVVSQKGIRAALKVGVDAVRSLDVLVRNVLGHDATVMNAWKNARHVNMTGKVATAGGTPERPAAPTAQPSEVDPLRRAS